MKLVHIVHVHRATGKLLTLAGIALCLLKRGVAYSGPQSTGFWGHLTQHILLRQSSQGWYVEIVAPLGDRCSHNLLTVHLPSVTFVRAGGDLRPCLWAWQAGLLGQSWLRGRSLCLQSGSVHVHQSAQSFCVRCGREEAARGLHWRPRKTAYCSHYVSPCKLSKHGATDCISFQGKHNYQWKWKLQVSEEFIIICFSVALLNADSSTSSKPVESPSHVD